jgi:hypothetical protein
MQRMKSTRSALLLAALALTAGAAVWVNAEPESAQLAELAQPMERARLRANPLAAGETPQLSLELLQRREHHEPRHDAFMTQSWAPPPPPPPPAVPDSPAAPSAPPLPFSYLGHIEQDGNTLMFLVQQDRNYVLKEGDVLDGTYQLDEVRPDLLTFTYLPLNIKQTLHLREGT